MQNAERVRVRERESGRAGERGFGRGREVALWLSGFVGALAETGSRVLGLELDEEVPGCDESNPGQRGTGWEVTGVQRDDEAGTGDERSGEDRLIVGVS